MRTKLGAGTELAYWERGPVSYRCQTSVTYAICHHVMSPCRDEGVGFAECHVGYEQWSMSQCVKPRQKFMTAVRKWSNVDRTSGPLMFSLCVPSSGNETVFGVSLLVPAG